MVFFEIRREHIPFVRKFISTFQQMKRLQFYYFFYFMTMYICVFQKTTFGYHYEVYFKMPKMLNIYLPAIRSEQMRVTYNSVIQKTCSPYPDMTTVKPALKLTLSVNMKVYLYIKIGTESSNCDSLTNFIHPTRNILQYQF